MSPSSNTPKYVSVQEYFKAEHPNLVGALGIPSVFWEKVKGNSFTNAEIENILQQDKTLDNHGQTHAATKALQQGRIQGKINDPG